jgi:hypothetical protein
MSINHLQRFNLRTFQKVESNHKKIRLTSSQIVGIYQQNQVILQKVKPPKTGVGKILDFAYKEILIPALIFSAGFTTAKILK